MFEFGQGNGDHLWKEVCKTWGQEGKWTKIKLINYDHDDMSTFLYVLETVLQQHRPEEFVISDVLAHKKQVNWDLQLIILGQTATKEKRLNNSFEEGKLETHCKHYLSWKNIY